MARERRSKGSGESARSVPAFSEPRPVELPSADIKPHPAFSYSSPSFLGKRAVTARRSRGCIEQSHDRWCFKPTGLTKKGKKKGDKCYHSEAEAIEAADGQEIKLKPILKFTGYRCAKKKDRQTCEAGDKSYDTFCWGSNSDPCGSPRATCPVQLVWVDGQPNLRFCKEVGEPGHMVPVTDVRQAMEISDAACESWPYKLGVVERADGTEGGGWDPEFFERNAPQIVTQAKQNYPDSDGLAYDALFGLSDSTPNDNPFMLGKAAAIDWGAPLKRAEPLPGDLPGDLEGMEPDLPERGMSYMNIALPVGVIVLLLLLGKKQK